MMNGMRPGWMRLAVAGVITAGLAFGITSLVTPSDSGPQKLYDVKPGAKTVEQVYKNIQVLKGMPVEDLYTTMESYSLSLGVTCEYCHVNNAYERDTKASKQIARRMIRLQMSINSDPSEGHIRVTCYSCHRGAVAVPLE